MNPKPKQVDEKVSPTTPAPSAPKLKPCPFCANKSPRRGMKRTGLKVKRDPSAYLSPSDWIVLCLDCGANGANHTTEAEAIAAWNVRDDSAGGGEWWCCSADYPNHEATCANYEPTKPAPASEAGSQDERDNGCKCQRCGSRYKVDFTVPDELWAKIHSDENLLCGACIVGSIENLDEFDYFNLVKPSAPSDAAVQAARERADLASTGAVSIPDAISEIERMRDKYERDMHNAAREDPFRASRRERWFGAKEILERLRSLSPSAGAGTAEKSDVFSEEYAALGHDERDSGQFD